MHHNISASPAGSDRKVCFMTGASGILGSEIALSVAGLGYNVFFTWHRSEDQAGQLLEQLQWISPESRMVRCNVADPADVAAAFGAFEREFGRLDLLVCSASNFFKAPLLELDEAAWDSLIDTNLKGCFFTMQQGARLMMRQPFRSRIIAFSDVAAGIGWPSFAPYSIAKAGIEHMCRLFARSCAPNLLVNAIAPGHITSNPLSGVEPCEGNEGKGRHGTEADPLDVARTVAFLMENDSITGQVITVDGGRMLWQR